MNCLTKELGDPVGKWAFPELEPWSQNSTLHLRGEARRRMGNIRSPLSARRQRVATANTERDPREGTDLSGDIRQGAYGAAQHGALLVPAKRNKDRIKEIGLCRTSRSLVPHLRGERSTRCLPQRQASSPLGEPGGLDNNRCGHESRYRGRIPRCIPSIVEILNHQTHLNLALGVGPPSSPRPGVGTGG